MNKSAVTSRAAAQPAARAGARKTVSAVAAAVQTASTEAPAKRVHGRRLADFIYEKVLATIVDGGVDVGMPSEVQLAADYGVSRPVIREALNRLRDDKIVTSRQGLGWFVVRRPSRQVLQYAPIGSIADLRRVFEFRLSIEPAAAEAAARHGDRALIAEVERAAKKLDDAVRRKDVAAELDFLLHLAIVKASGNQFFISALESIRSHIQTGISLNRTLSLVSESRTSRVSHEHLAVVDAIKRGDADGARAAMYAHLDGARLRVFEGA